MLSIDSAVLASGVPIVETPKSYSGVDTATDFVTVSPIPLSATDCVPLPLVSVRLADLSPETEGVKVKLAAQEVCAGTPAALHVVDESLKSAAFEPATAKPVKYAVALPVLKTDTV